MFLKRCQLPGITQKEISIGATLVIFAREIKVVEYGDINTQKAWENSLSRTMLMIKPDAYRHSGKIINAIYANGFVINRMKMIKLTQEEAEDLFANQKQDPTFAEMIAHISKDVIIAMELISENAIEKLLSLIGPLNPQAARTNASNTLRAQFGVDPIRNAVYGSEFSIYI